jgi:hypothetical protein
LNFDIRQRYLLVFFICEKKEYSKTIKRNSTIFCCDTIEEYLKPELLNTIFQFLEHILTV